MAITNFEFKAKVRDIESLEKKLLQLSPKFIGEDNQSDTYFNVSKGRLKLREGNIENALIYYERQDSSTAKQSDILLYQHEPHQSLKAILTKVHGIKVIVIKQRRIYFIDNVKFHFDIVPGLGTFIEVEAIDDDGSIGAEKLKKQCDTYASLFNILPEDLIKFSYSDMILHQQEAQ